MKACMFLVSLVLLAQSANAGWDYRFKRADRDYASLDVFDGTPSIGLENRYDDGGFLSCICCEYEPRIKGNYHVFENQNSQDRVTRIMFFDRTPTHWLVGIEIVEFPEMHTLLGALPGLRGIGRGLRGTWHVHTFIHYRIVPMVNVVEYFRGLNQIVALDAEMLQQVGRIQQVPNFDQLVLQPATQILTRLETGARAMVGSSN